MMYTLIMLSFTWVCKLIIMLGFNFYNPYKLEDSLFESESLFESLRVNSKLICLVVICNSIPNFSQLSWTCSIRLIFIRVEFSYILVILQTILEDSFN